MNNSRGAMGNPQPKTVTNFSRIVLWLLCSVFIWVTLIGIFRLFYGDYNHLVDTRLEALLPRETDHNKDGDRFMERLSREIVFMVSWQGDDSQDAAFADSLASQAEQTALGAAESYAEPLFGEHGTALSQTTARFVWEHRYSFAPPPLVVPEALIPGEAQDAFSENVISSLYSPFGGYTAGELEHDPFMAVRTAAASFVDGYTLSTRGYPIKHTGDGWHHMVVRLGMVRDIKSSESSLLFSRAEAWRMGCASGYKCVYTGPAFYAESSQAASTADLSRIGFVSTIVLVVLFLLVFRSWRELVLTIIMLAGVLITGFLLVLAIFGNIHAVALGMGGTLCGICADYAIHVFIHQKPDLSFENLRASLKKPLFWSFVTSALAYVVLALTGIKVLAELAVMAVAALAYAWLSVYLVFIKLNGQGPRSETVGSAFLWFSRALPTPIKVIFACGMACWGILLFFSSNPDDDCASMQARSGILVSMNQAVMSATGGGPVSAFYQITGKDVEEALSHCTVLAALPEFKDAFMPCRLLPGISEQKSRYALYRALFPVLESVLAQEDVKINLKDADLEKPHYFTPDEFPGDLKGFVGEKSVLIRVAVDSPAHNMLKNISYAEHFDRRAQWSAALGHIRIALEEAFPWALLGVIIVGIILLRHRVIIGMTLPLLAGIGAGLVGVYYGADGYFSLFTVLALFMLLGLGADYCIFLGKKTDEAEAVRGASGVLLALATTEAAFGALAFSGTAVISAFGLVLACGLPVIIIATPVFNPKKDSKRAPQKGIGE